MKLRMLLLILKKLKMITREYYEQEYTNKSDNMNEMDRFLETQNLSSLNHKEIENLNRSIAIKEIKSVIKIS